MGIYSNNSTTLNSDDIIANESYANSFGSLELMVECQQNDLILFNNVIQSDLREASYITSGDESLLESVDILNEAGVKGILSSAVILIEKIAGKIKAIFDKFIGKLSALLTKDTTKLFKKYKASWETNDFSKMAVKNYKPLKDLFAVDLNTFKDIEIADALISGNTAITTVDRFLGETIDLTSEVDPKKYDETVEKLMFGDSTDQAGAVYNDKSIIEDILTSENMIKKIKEKKTYCLNRLAVLKKDAKRAEQDVVKDGADSEAFTSAHNIVKNLNNATSACTKSFNTYTKYIKKAIAQSKKVFVMACTFTPKKESEILEARGEVVREEVMDFFFDDEN